jgi:hypothetical protein
MFVFDTKNQKSFREEEMPKGKKLKRFQEIVGGNIETLPHKKGWNAPFTAYANEEGMIKDLPSNFLSWGVLRHLGFLVENIGFHFGNVVLIGHNERALTEKNKELVRAALLKYRKEIDDDDEIDDDADVPEPDEKGTKTKADGDVELEKQPETKRQKKE